MTDVTVILKTEGDLEVPMQSQQAPTDLSIIWQLSVHSTATVYAKGDKSTMVRLVLKPPKLTAVSARGPELTVPVDCSLVAVSQTWQ